MHGLQEENCVAHRHSDKQGRKECSWSDLAFPRLKFNFPVKSPPPNDLGVLHASGSGAEKICFFPMARHAEGGFNKVLQEAALIRLLLSAIPYYRAFSCDVMGHACDAAIALALHCVA